MNNKFISISVGLVVIIAVGAFVYFQSQSKSSYTNTAATAQSTGTTSTNATMLSYSMSEVSTHADKVSCWTVIDKQVYDLTQWTSQHPGGEQAILSLCGVDGTAAFHGQHDDNKKQANILAGYKAGELVN